jgi:hypothetical protein
MGDLKIGVLFSAYNCARYIDECLNPWLELKEELNLVLAATNGRYLLSPSEVGNAKGCESLVKLTGKNIDFLLHSPSVENNWTEEEGRTFMLKYVLGQKVDLIWVIDCDEIYTKENIYNILSYIKENPDPDCYTISFKNYFVKYPYWINDGFNKAVLYWTDRKKGIDCFSFDCDIAYNDGTMTNFPEELKNEKIGKNVAFINHYSWIQDDPRIKDKIHNQETKYIGEEGARCAYRYNEKGHLVFNEKFYNCRGIKPPEIFETIINELHISDIFCDFENNIVYFKNITDADVYFVRIYDEYNNDIYFCSLSLFSNSWMAPGRRLDGEKSFFVEMQKDSQVVKKIKVHVDFLDY